MSVMHWHRSNPGCLRCGVAKRLAKPGHRGLCRPCYDAEQDAGRAEHWPRYIGKTYNPAKMLAESVGGTTAARLLSVPFATLAGWMRRGTPPERADDARRALAAVCSGEMKPTEDGSYAA